MKPSKIIISSLLFVLSICSCSGKNNKTLTPIDFHTQLQFDYLNDFIEDVAFYADGTKELSKPKGYEITFDNKEGILYTIELESAVDNRKFKIRDESYTFNNLYLNTNYHYRVLNGEQVISKGNFITNDLAPRNIDVDGITNFRDLGGHQTDDGGFTKQGMIYRSAKFSENGKKDALITNRGRNTVLNDLKIKSEIDLRLISNNETGGLTKSVIGDSINYYNVPMTFDGDVFDNNKGEIKHLFDIVSLESNYPLVFHCSIGTDRTGFVACLLNSLLEVNKEEIYRDYLFSNFGLIGGSRNASAISSYFARFSLYDGLSLKEQVISYLISIGVNRNNIDNFLSIMSN